MLINEYFSLLFSLSPNTHTYVLWCLVPCQLETLLLPGPLAMVLSSLFFLDLKGKILISRDYRGDISPKYAEEFIDLLSEREIAMEMGENCEGQAMNGTGSVSNIQPPIFHKDGISYCYIKHNNLYRKIKCKLRGL